MTLDVVLVDGISILDVRRDRGREVGPRASKRGERFFNRLFVGVPILFFFDHC